MAMYCCKSIVNQSANKYIVVVVVVALAESRILLVLKTSERHSSLTPSIKILKISSCGIGYFILMSSQ